MLFDLPVCANDAEAGAAYESACAESVGLNRRRCSCKQRPLFFFSVHEFNEVFFRRQSPSMRRIYALTAYIIYSGDDEAVLEKVKIFVNRRFVGNRTTAYPLNCAVSHSRLSSESKATLAKVLSGFASTMRARFGFAWAKFVSCQLPLEEAY